MMRTIIFRSSMSKDLFGQARELEIASLPKEEVALIKQRTIEEQYQEDKENKYIKNSQVAEQGQH